MKPQLSSRRKSRQESRAGIASSSLNPTLFLSLLDLHNAERTKAGIKAPLKMDAALVAGAQRNADWMLAKGRLSHAGPFRGWLAENAAWGSPQLTPEAVMRLWMGSRGHRENILGPYTRFGAGKAGGYWCVDFR